MPLNVKILGGKGEIGNNKILIEHKSKKLLLDFGLSFKKYKDYFSEFLQPRKCNALPDFMEFGLIPRLRGIYRKDHCYHCGMIYDEKPSVNALLLSHAHIDHAGLINFLREDIPIYCTEETYLILKAMEETANKSFADFVNLKKDFYFVRKRNLSRLKGDEARIPRKFVIMEPYKKYQIDDIEVEAIPVDHSLPGACAFIVYTDDGNLIYTGDFRFHGRRGELTRKFVRLAEKAFPKIMICEGTRIHEKKGSTKREEDVEKESKEVVDKCKSLAIVNYPVRDLDRLLTFFNVANSVGRTLVVNTKQAYLLRLFEKIKRFPKIEDIAVYVERKGWGLISDDFYFCIEENEEKWVKGSEIGEDEIRKDYFKWEKEFLELENMITYKEIKQNPENFIFRCDNFELHELIDIKPRKGSIYIRSLTEPFSEDMVIDEKRVQRWLEHFNIPENHRYQKHASGHASGEEIAEMLRKIEPENVIPVHTEHAEIFKKII